MASVGIFYTFTTHAQIHSLETIIVKFVCDMFLNDLLRHLSKRRGNVYRIVYNNVYQALITGAASKHLIQLLALV